MRLEFRHQTWHHVQNFKLRVNFYPPHFFCSMYCMNVTGPGLYTLGIRRSVSP